MLRTGSRGKRWRTRGRRKCIRIDGQAWRKEIERSQTPTSGNAEIVVAKAIHDTELVGHANGRSEISCQRNAVRNRASIERRTAYTVARGEPVEKFAVGRRVGLRIRIILSSGKIHIAKVAALETELLGWERIAVAPAPVVAEEAIAGRIYKSCP